MHVPSLHWYSPKRHRGGGGGVVVVVVGAVEVAEHLIGISELVLHFLNTK
jgi:hypothetical protein